jgi:hypothetical protein
VLNTTLKRLDWSAAYLQAGEGASGMGNKEDRITSLILGLIFKGPMRKVHAKYDLYLYPYLSKIKLLMLIDELVSTTHKINIENVFRTLEAYLCGVGAFPEKDEKKEAWHATLNAKLSQLQHEKPKILQSILKKGKEINSLMPYKNFENMVAHSLEQDDTRVCMSKKLLGIVLRALATEARDTKETQTRESLAIQVPAKNDPVFRVAS